MTAARWSGGPRFKWSSLTSVSISWGREGTRKKGPLRIEILLRLPDRSGYSTQGDSFTGYRWVLGHGTDLFLMVQGSSRGPGLGAERISEEF